MKIFNCKITFNKVLIGILLLIPFWVLVVPLIAIVVYPLAFKAFYSPQWRGGLADMIPEKALSIIDASHTLYFLGDREYEAKFFVEIDKNAFPELEKRMQRTEFYEKKKLSSREWEIRKEEIPGKYIKYFDENSFELSGTVVEGKKYYKYDVFCSNNERYLYVNYFQSGAENVIPACMN